LAIVAPAAAKRGLELRQSYDPGLPAMVCGDPKRLQQVLLNLLSNAVKFTDRGEVVLEVSIVEQRPDRARLRFAVRDTGIGIPANAHKAIFEPFVQADTSTTRRYGGTGLGLPICSKLIALMGGKLELQSELGEGSTFSFTLTLALEGNGAAAPVPRPQGRILRSRRQLQILLAEDNLINQKVAARLLEKMGHEITIASDGCEALEAMEGKSYDLVLMDCQMPRMDGYAATQAIRQLNLEHRIPIVAMTADATPDGKRRCIESGMDFFLTKPVDAGRLFNLIEQVAASIPVCQ
jgi:CheY-like chemotaxis protein